MKIDTQIERRAIVRAVTLLATEHSQSTEETRYYLNGTYIEPGPGGVGALAVATNGHHMIEILDEHAIQEGAPTIWMADAKRRLAGPIKAALKGMSVPKVCGVWIDLQTIPKSLKRGTVKAVLAPSAAVVRAGEGHTLCSFEDDIAIDGTFPEWRRVVPKTAFGLLPSVPHQPLAMPAIGFAVLTAILAVAKTLSLTDVLSTEGKSSQLRFWPSATTGADAATGPMHVNIWPAEIRNGYFVHGIVAPIRGSAKADNPIPEWIWSKEAIPEAEVAKAA